MFKDLVLANRSYRGYDENYRLSREDLLDLVDCARLTPSSVNAQPLAYFLAPDKETADKIQPLTKWARALPQLELPHGGMHPTAFIIICQNTEIDSSLARYQKDIGIAAQTILLAAAEKGLGGCMIGNYGAAAVREALSLPAHMAPVLIVALGKPLEKIVLTELAPGENSNYYRDENDVHYVPKRRLEDIVIN